MSPRLLWGVIGGFVVIALALGLGLGLGLGLRSAVAVDSNLVNRWVDDNLHAVWQFDADGTLTVEGQDGQLLARGSYRTQNVGPGNVGPGRDSILSIRGDELLRLLTWSAFEYGSVVGSANLALFPVDEPTGRLFLTREDRYYPGD